MSFLPLWKIIVLALFAGVIFGGYLQGLRWNDDIAICEKTASDKINVMQQTIIARQAFMFERYNQIARQVNHHAITIKAQSIHKQAFYRDIIEQEEVGHTCVPAPVADRLFDYANRLRHDALHAITISINATDTDTLTSGCRLTYAQAIYWLDPLLTALDEANSKLSAIRRIEEHH